MLNPLVLVTSFFLLKCHAEIERVSSTLVASHSDLPFSGYQAIPPGGILCDRVNEPSVLFDAVEIIDAIKNTDLKAQAADRYTSKRFRNGNSACAQLNTRYYTASLGNATRGLFHVDWTVDPVTREAVMCNVAAIESSTGKKAKSCTGLPARQRLAPAQKRQNVPKTIVCPRGHHGAETNVTADSVDIGHGFEMPVYQTYQIAQEKYLPGESCSGTASRHPLYRAPIKGGAILVDFFYDASKSQVLFCSAIATDAPGPDVKKNRCREFMPPRPA